jgi:hypothetical protein
VISGIQPDSIGGTMKGSQKPEKLQKKQPQKTLKQRRSGTRAAPKKYGSG